MVDDSMLVRRLPRIWIGYGMGLVVPAGQILSMAVSEDLAGSILLVTAFFGIAGWFYWLYCVFKYHDVMSSIQGYEHPISPGRAIGMHWIPLYNLYWVFKWPREIATFVNWRTQSPRGMNGNIVGLIVLAGFVLRSVDLFLSLIVLFTAGTYISNRIRKACLADAVPKELHARAAAGPLGL